MKKSIWISITTLMLCLGVMAFGVYSAISANLNITGNLGFNIHDCVVGVSGTIYNLSEMDADGTSARLYDKTLGTTIMGGESTTTSTISLGDMYFYHGAYVDPETKMATVKTYDIIFQITITNLSEHRIKMTVPAPTLGNTSAITMLDADDNAEYTSFPYEGKIAKNTQKTIMFALRLTDKTELTQKVAFDWEGITFEEYVPQLVKYDSTNNYYYIEMGVNPFDNNEPLRWISFAKEQDNGSYDFFNKTNEPQPNETYYFISELILRATSTTSRSEGGIPFQGDYTYVDSSTAKVTGTDYQAQDYAISNVRKFLNNQEAYTTSTYSNKVATPGSTKATLTSLGYNIVESEAYNYITPRNLSDLYEVGTKMTTTYNCGTEKDSLWLLSYTTNSTRGDTNSEVNWVRNNYGYGSATADGGTSAADWWLRSPHASSAGNVRGVDPVSAGVNPRVAYGAYGVRPAFQITIP
ncbi:MAG: hypothetical protein IJ318_02695 [Clostridia bacterium]|nr:hypothetical protein [Clostridia bacterium]